MHEPEGKGFGHKPRSPGTGDIDPFCGEHLGEKYGYLGMVKGACGLGYRLSHLLHESGDVGCFIGHGGIYRISRTREYECIGLTCPGLLQRAKNSFFICENS